MDKTETVQEYMNYVKSVLSSINPNEAKASYSTGSGMVIVNANLGDEAHYIDLMDHVIAKIRTPNIRGEQWYVAWDMAIELVNKELTT